jgi:hypothetical protein
MKQSEPEDIKILTDAVEAIRRRPAMYLKGQDKASGEWLAERLVSEIIALRCLPVTLEKVGAWWIISASVGWLYGDERDVERIFNTFNIVPGIANSFRGEILLTAFADAVVVCGPEGVRWLKGSPATRVLPASINLCRLASEASVVAFCMPDGLEIAAASKDFIPSMMDIMITIMRSTAAHSDTVALAAEVIAADARFSQETIWLNIMKDIDEKQFLERGEFSGMLRDACRAAEHAFQFDGVNPTLQEILRGVIRQLEERVMNGTMEGVMLSIRRSKRAGCETAALAAEVLAADSRFNARIADMKDSGVGQDYFLELLDWSEVLHLKCQAAAKAFEADGDHQRMHQLLIEVRQELESGARKGK